MYPEKEAELRMHSKDYQLGRRASHLSIAHCVEDYLLDIARTAESYEVIQFLPS